MAVIHCTQKLLKELGNPPLADTSRESPDVLASWYANLLRINRRKCVLFTNEKTLYSFLVPNLVKAHFMDLRTVFLTHLSLNLQYEGFGNDVIESVRREHKEILFAKTGACQPFCVNGFFGLTKWALFLRTLLRTDSTLPSSL